MDLNTFYQNKKYHIIYISIYEIIANFLVFALFVHGMIPNKIRPAFGIFVAGPALIMGFSPCNFHFLKDEEYVKEHKYHMQQVCVRFGLSCINLITCINPRSGIVYWMHDTYIRGSFFIYMFSAIYMMGVTFVLIHHEKKFLKEFENTSKVEINLPSVIDNVVIVQTEETTDIVVELNNDIVVVQSDKLNNDIVIVQSDELNNDIV